MTDQEQLEWLTGELAAAGVPNEGVSLAPPRVDYLPHATDEQRAAGASILASFTPSDAAAVTVRKRKAKAALVATEDAGLLATRNALRVVFLSLAETRQAVNALIDHLASGTPLPAKLPNRTWPQVLGAARQMIDQETDPTA